MSEWSPQILEISTECKMLRSNILSIELEIKNLWHKKNLCQSFSQTTSISSGISARTQEIRRIKEALYPKEEGLTSLVLSFEKEREWMEKNG